MPLFIRAGLKLGRYFIIVNEIWNKETHIDDAETVHANIVIFPTGEPKDAFAKYFVGQSYLAPISKEQVFIANVTFESGCRNNWHVHKASKDSE